MKLQYCASTSKTRGIVCMDSGQANELVLSLLCLACHIAVGSCSLVDMSPVSIVCCLLLLSADQSYATEEPAKGGSGMGIPVLIVCVLTILVAIGSSVLVMLKGGGGGGGGGGAAPTMAQVQSGTVNARMHAIISTMRSPSEGDDSHVAHMLTAEQGGTVLLFIRGHPVEDMCYPPADYNNPTLGERLNTMDKERVWASGISESRKDKESKGMSALVYMPTIAADQAHYRISRGCLGSGLPTNRMLKPVKQYTACFNNDIMPVAR